MKRLLLAFAAGAAAGWLAREKRVRVALKLALRHVTCVTSFCRDCGLDVRDFVAPDEVWQQIWGSGAGVLCYQCFADRCAAAGIDPVWQLGSSAPLPSESCPGHGWVVISEDLGSKDNANQIAKALGRDTGLSWVAACISLILTRCRQCRRRPAPRGGI